MEEKNQKVLAKKGRLKRCCIAIMISITTIMIEIPAVRMSLFLSTFSPWRHEERDANHKSQCQPYYTDPYPTHGASCNVYDLNSSLPVETQTDLFWSDPKNLTKHFHGRTSNTWLFKILKFSGLSLPVTMSTSHLIHSNWRPASFSLWRFIITDDNCHILSVRA